MSTDLRPTPALLAPLALALALPADRAPAPDEPAFQPGAYTILTKRYVERTELEVDAFEVRLDGEPMTPEDVEVTVVGDRLVVLSDEYAEVEGGRILDLVRTFEELAGEVSVALDGASREEHAVRGRSELEGAVVRFEWDPDAEEYVRSFEEGGTGDDDHLAALELDTDLVGFLPPGGVEVDETWEVDPAALGRVLAPSGDLRLLPDGIGDEPYVDLDLQAMLAALQVSLAEVSDPWEGEVTARYVGSDEEDGVRIGLIALEFDVECEADLLERLERTIDHLGLDRGEEFTALTLSWSLVGEGELAWNLDAGHVHAFRCEPAVAVEARLAWTEEFFDETLEIEGLYQLSGTTRVTLTLD